MSSSVYNWVRSDEFAPNIRLNGGTALDCSSDGSTLVLADSSDLIRLDIETGTAEKRPRSNNKKIVRMIKCHPKNPEIFATINGSNVEFWQELNPLLPVIKTTRITDFDFDFFDVNRSVIASTESVVLIDSRTKEQTRMPLLFGANQAQFSQASEYLLFTAQVSDIRCFDTRNTKAPYRQFVTSGHHRHIISMQLHPTDSNSLVTSSSDEAKYWSRSGEGVQSNLLDHANIKKFAFTPQTGEAFVGLNLLSKESRIKLWQVSELNTSRDLRHNVTDFLDICWQKNCFQNQYLFSLSRHNSIFRHLVTSTIQKETITMRAPIKQSAQDEALDRMVLIAPARNKKNPQQNVPRHKSSNPMDLNDPRSNLLLDSTEKSWNCWLRAPSIHGEDLLFELNSVRKLGLLGLSCNEINFQRAAIGLSYSHYGIYKKIIIEIRFHRNFIENGLIFLELLKKDSPLSSQTAKELLRQLGEEAIRQKSKDSSLSVLARTLRQLQPIFDSIKIFPPVNAELLGQGRLSIVNDELECHKSSDKTLPADKEIQNSAPYETSPYDSFVPSPRLSGGRFNQNGFLCLFGQVECLFHILPNTNDDDKPSKMSHGSRCLINKGFKPVVSHHEEQKTASRLANKHEQTQPSFMRTLSDYHSFATQFMLEKGSQEVPAESNHSFTIYNEPKTTEHELDTRRRLSSITLEETTSSTSLAKSNRGTVVLSPLRRRQRGISITSVADSQAPEVQATSSVTVLDTTVFQNVSRILAQHYRIYGGSIAQICYHNMWVVIKYAPYKRELIALWQIFYEMFNCEEEREMSRFFYPTTSLFKPKNVRRGRRNRVDSSSVNVHPFDRRFMAYFIDYYYSKFDIQTASLLSCILMRSIDELTEEVGDTSPPRESTQAMPNKMIAYEHYIPLFVTKEEDGQKIGEQILLHRRLTKPRANKRMVEYSDTSSTCNSFEHKESFFPAAETIESMTLPPKHDDDTCAYDLQLNKQRDKDDEEDKEEVENMNNSGYALHLKLSNKMYPDYLGLDNRLREYLEQLCMTYSIMLFQWHFLNQRAELLKCIKADVQEARFRQVLRCTRCNEKSTDGSCLVCNCIAIVCIVCDQECTGLITACKICGHGGHIEHVSEYFSVFDSCYCGCRCGSL